MALVQAWPAPTSGNTSAVITETGPVTTAGNTLFVSLVVRSEDVDSVTITDDGGNTWTEVDSHTDVLMYVGLFRATNAAAVSSITVTGVDSSQETVVASSFALLEEWSGVGDEVGTSTVTTSTDGGEPDPITATDTGQILLAVGASNVSNRTWSITGTGVTPTEEEAFQGGQLTHRRAHATTSGSGDAAIGWDRTAGSAANMYIINALFEAGEAGPSPLSVDAGADQSVYVGQSSSVSASASGGTAPYSYAWTVISGQGSFLNSNQANTTFTPTGGAGTRTLRCIVTDANSSTAQDDLTVTVSQAPEFVTIASVNDSTGWTPTGGTVQQVLSDTSDSTLITSIENPTEQVLDVVMGPAVVGEGQNWTQRVRMRRSSSASSGTATGYLYVGSTLISTVTGRNIPGSVGDVDFTFPNADIDTITTQQWTDGVRFVVEVTAR